jgi:quinoprotein dehydrogenase-associated probable ABC transporter substrate-binding protein
MFSRSLEIALAGAALVLAVGAVSAAERELRVCADPDNLPYSHQDESGFENRIARIVADELGARLAYTWFPQRRSFVRNTLNARVCDVAIGVPSDFELALTTTPYYRSTYVFVYRADAPLAFRSFDDEHLKNARVGVQLIGDDLAATPPGHALAVRGIVKNVQGFPVYGERPQPEVMIEALARRQIDVALVWGPQAAYYARRQAVPLTIVPTPPPPELAFVPFEFSMSMAVRKSDVALKAELDRVIERRQADFDAVLREYGVPRADVTAARVQSRSAQ